MPDDDYLWDPAAAPDPEIARLEEALRPLRYRPPAAPPALAPQRPGRAWGRFAAGLAAAVLVAGLGTRALVRGGEVPWTVTALRGPLLAGGEAMGGAGERSVLSPGDWVETGRASAARIRVGRIGRADLGPGTRARLVRAEGTEHRMAMEYGTMHARISAPPRYFLVETPSALAIDLGCVYTLRVEPGGRGLLRVQSGEVELVAGNRRSFVPAGNLARLAPGSGPGLPYPAYATAGFRAAVHAWEASAAPAELERLLAAADSGSTITLWHLLQRVPAAERGGVFDRLAALAPVPPGVTREAAVRLEQGAVAGWRSTLQAGWTREEDATGLHARWRRFWQRMTGKASAVG